MHYYQFNIGDYKSHTEHLSDMEDLAYRRLLDWYYLHETPIPLDEAEVSRQIRMRSHSDCIAIVLREYFERTDDGWIHHRADKELAKAGDKSQKASDSAKARWNKQKDANALQPKSEGNATHNTEHITQNTDITHDLAPARSSPAAPISEIVELYNKHLPMLPQITVINDSRKRMISARWREVVTTDKLDRQKGLEFFDWFFCHVGRSKFLTGKTKDWKANFEFLFTASKFPRIVEGAYHQEQK
jgi:uncharacterized protein YdaU (DUF1376 family)